MVSGNAPDSTGKPSGFSPSLRPGESKTSPRRLVAVERQRQSLELRKAGMTFAAIAVQLGYKDQRGAFYAVNTALKKVLRPPAESLRTLDLERLDTALLALWPRVRRGDDKAITTMLRVMERRARLLGLDSPIEVDLKDITPPPKELSDTELEEVIRNGRLLNAGGSRAQNN